MAWFQCRHTITGEVSGFNLTKPLVSVGRASNNDLVLADPMIGKSHASLVRTESTYSISATSSNAAIYINGRSTKTAKLDNGDIVLIGAWELTFATQRPVAGSSNQPTSETGLLLLEKLVEISADLMRDTTPRRLFTNLLQGVVELTSAEKGFVVVFKDGSRYLGASHNVDNDRLDISNISDSIVNQVVKHLKPVIVSDALHDSRFGTSKSVVDLKLSSVLCVPLIYRTDLLGVIYLGNDSITDLFTQEDLSSLVIFASMASMIIHNALMLNQLKVDNKNLRDRLKSSSQGQIIGTSKPMKSLFKMLRRIGPTDLSILVLGETGTGKELVAREVHNLSTRAKGPFVAINCGAIPDNLLESELFGHKKGSFTGAISDKVGKTEAANGGTLFLDEIGEMPMNLQVKLLRVLQERTIERVGDLQPRPIDIRVVSATNQNLQELIQNGKFREDLLYRLNEVSVELPPLRDRGEDIEVLAKYFLSKYKGQYNAKATGYTNQALLALKNAHWPGNIRELESRIKKALILSDRALLNPDDLGLEDQDKRSVLPLTDAQEQFKVDYIREVLELNNWNKAQTARDLGVDVRTIFRYVDKFEEPDQ